MSLISNDSPKKKVSTSQKQHSNLQSSGSGQFSLLGRSGANRTSLKEKDNRIKLNTNRSTMLPKELGNKNSLTLLETSLENGSDLERERTESSVPNVDLNEQTNQTMEHDEDAEKEDQDDDDDQLEMDHGFEQEPPAPVRIGKAKRQRDEMEGLEGDEQANKRRRTQIQDKSTEIKNRLDRIERILLKQAYRRQQEDSKEESAEEEDEDDDEEDDYLGDQDDEDDDKEDDLEDDSLKEDEEERSVESPHPHSKQSKLTVDGRAAREILQEHFGPLNQFLPLTYSLSKRKKDSIINQTDSLEAFIQKSER
jgi:hypothetical protein